jgi:hypothetical protein
MTLDNGLEDRQRRQRRVLMPMVIIAAAISIGMWFSSSGDTAGDDMAKHIRALLSRQCDASLTGGPVHWALPVVQSTFESAAGDWCAAGVDPKAVTITSTSQEGGGQLVTLRAASGDTIELLVTLEPSGTPLVSSVKRDPAKP